MAQLFGSFLERESFQNIIQLHILLLKRLLQWLTQVKR